MNIGFDVDNVLVDQAGYQLRYGKPYFEKKGYPVINQDGFDIEDIFGCSHSEREKFWTKYIWSYCLKEPMTAGAAEVAKKLRTMGHKVVIVTGRAHTTETGITGKLFRWMLVHWLKKNDFEYDDIFYCSESESANDKVRICVEQKIDLMIDDKPENLLALKDKLRIVCYPANWNKNNKELDGYRINSIEDVLEMLQ